MKTTQEEESHTDISPANSGYFRCSLQQSWCFDTVRFPLLRDIKQISCIIPILMVKSDMIMIYDVIYDINGSRMWLWL